MESFARHDDYHRGSLDRADVAVDPIVQFGAWLADAEAAGLAEPNAMVLSTVDAEGHPTSRTVLLKGIVEGRFEFVTSDESRKGRALQADGRVSLAFPWYSLQRQILIDGVASRAPAGLSDRYWASRPRGSQIGGWASNQSAPIVDRAALDAQTREVSARFREVTEIPRPPHWGAWLVEPHRIELWQGRPSRMHDRLVYQPLASGGWRLDRLQP